MTTSHVRLLSILTAVVVGLTQAGRAAPSDAAGQRDDAAVAEGPSDSSSQVDVAVVAARTTVVPGGQVPVAVIFRHNPGWHVQAHVSRDPDAMLTEIVVAVPASSPLNPHDRFVQWPQPKLGRFGGGVIEAEVFDGTAIAYLPISVAADAEPGPAALSITVSYQACDAQVCLQPATETFEVMLDVAPLAEADAAPIDAALFGGFDTSVWARIASGDAGPQLVRFDLFGVAFDIDAAGALGLALLLLLAALGGLLLNFTPCVLPVIPIKIMSLGLHAGNRARTLLLGVVMSLGIVAFWLAIGVLIGVTKQFGAISELFKYPSFSLVVGAFIALMAVGMCGVFSLRLPQFVSNISPSQESVAGTFGMGVMTAVLSTPCTAPFMGAAAAWAATQSPQLVLLTFSSIGAGMALPYLWLSAAPGLTKRMPRTGPASDLIKQVMGLLMLAAAAYFIGSGLSGMVRTLPEPASRAYWWTVALFSAMAGLWLVWHTFRITRRPFPRAFFGVIGVAVLLLSAGMAVWMTDKGPIDWTYYTAERFAQAKQDGKVVVMEFTAEWCLNCKALEQTVLRDPRVVELLRGDSIEPIKVDLTGNYAAGNDMLRSVNRLTIPLLVVFAPDGREVFKGDFYKPDQVVQAIADAARGQVAAQPLER
jgi:thiol:disulfide interchange protein